MTKHPEKEDAGVPNDNPYTNDTKADQPPLLGWKKKDGSFAEPIPVLRWMPGKAP